MKQILTLFFILAALTTSAQQFQELSLYLGAAKSGSKYNAEPKYVDEQRNLDKINILPHIGLKADFSFSPNISFTGGLHFGFNKFAMPHYAIIPVPPFASRFRTTYTHTYLGMSLLYNYRIIKKLCVSLGVEPSIYFDNNNEPTGRFDKINNNSSTFGIAPLAQISYKIVGLTWAIAYKTNITKIQGIAYNDLRYNEWRFSVGIPLYNKDRSQKIKHQEESYDDNE